MCLRGGTSTLLVCDPFREAPPHAVPGQVDWCGFFFSKTTSEVVSHVSQGFVACMCKMMILAWSAFWTLRGCDAKCCTSCKTIRLNILIEKIAIPVTNPSFAKQQRVSKSPMDREDIESPCNCYIYSKKYESHLTQMDHLHYLTLLHQLSISKMSSCNCYTTP